MISLLTVVPVRARLVDLFGRVSSQSRLNRILDPTYDEVIGESVPRSDGALGETGWAIHRVGPVLEQAMKVHARRFVDQAILQVDNNAFSDLGFDGRKRPLIVDADDRPRLQAIRVAVDPGQFPIVRDSKHACGLSQGGKQRQYRKHGSGVVEQREI